MSGLAETLQEFAVKVPVQSQTVFGGVVADIEASIKVGSAVTGSRGQPVDTKELRDSWHTEYETPQVALISTSGVPWARQNEDGIARPGGGPYVQRSPVGGRWSVALTVAGVPLIVEDVVARMKGAP